MFIYMFALLPNKQLNLNLNLNSPKPHVSDIKKKKLKFSVLFFIEEVYYRIFAERTATLVLITA